MLKLPDVLFKEAKIEAKDKDLRTPLLFASIKGTIEMVRLLFDIGAETNTKDSFGRTPLHIAAINGNLEMVKLLLRIGAVIDIEVGA